MAATRKSRVPLAELIRLINEYRQSGMTAADWRRENDISISTFYNWVSRCRKVAADQIPAPNYGHHVELIPKQDVVPINIVPDQFPEQNTVSQMQQIHLDNSHTIEVTMKGIVIRIRNNVDPILLTRTLRLLQIGQYAHGISLFNGIDRNFEASTNNGVISFQSRNGLTADGIVGKDTMKKLAGIS